MLPHVSRGSLVCVHAESRGQHVGGLVYLYSDLPYPCATNWWHGDAWLQTCHVPALTLHGLGTRLHVGCVTRPQV